jgi:hypothetical protein
MSFWFWVGLIVISTLSVPIVALVEKMKNRSPAPAKEAAWNPEGDSDQTGDEMPAAEPEGELAAVDAGEATFEDGGLGFDDGVEMDGLSDDDFK